MPAFKKNWLRQIVWVVLIGAASTILVLSGSNQKFMRLLELKSYDARMSFLSSHRPKPKNVVMFYVDEPSLSHMESQGVSWPWPRELYASVLDFCARGQAKAVVFDIFYSEDSVYGVADDEAFAEGVKRVPTYFVLFLSDEDRPADGRVPAVLSKSAVSVSTPVPNWVEKDRALMSLPISSLVDSAKGFGNAQIPPDEDGVYRKMNLLSAMGNFAVPSISLKVVTDLSGGNISFAGEGKMSFGGVQIPITPSGEIMLNYYGGADTFPAYPLAQVMVSDMAISAGKTPDLNPSIVKDKVVIIGVAAPGLYDLKPTPLAKVFPGPEVHATAIENLIEKDFISPYGGMTAISMTAFFAFASAFGLAFISASWGIALLIAFLCLLIGGSVIFAFASGAWIPVVAPAASFALSAFATILKNYFTEGKKRRQIRNAFKQYLSPHVVAEISKDPDSLKLGGLESEVTLFFSDIADFTTISEKTSPKELVSKLNEYFSLATGIIQRRGGTLDKYIGDAIMAFWGAPLVTCDHAAQAVLSAMEIQRELKKKSPFKTRIGLHTGAAVVGNIGSDIRFNYTAIGDTVNLASRLEGLNKQIGTDIMMSESTNAMCHARVESRRIGKVRVKGRSEPVGIYEPLGEKGNYGRLTKTACEKFLAALRLFESANFAEAEKLFLEISEEFDDTVSKKYAGYSAGYAKDPAENFDGVINFKTK